MIMKEATLEVKPTIDEKFKNIKEQASPTNAAMEYILGYIADFRLSSRYSFKEYVELRSQQLDDLLGVVSQNSQDLSTREKLAAIHTAKLLSTGFLEMMMKIRNKKLDGDKITKSEIVEKANSLSMRIQEVLVVVPEVLFLGENHLRDLILENTIKHFHEITGEVIEDGSEQKTTV